MTSISTLPRQAQPLPNSADEASNRTASTLGLARLLHYLHPRSPGPAARLAFGLVALMLSVLLLSDMFVSGFVADPSTAARRERTAVAQIIGAYVTQVLRNDDEMALRQALESSVRLGADLRSARLLIRDQQRAEAGDHARYWRLLAGAPSTMDNLRLPVVAGGSSIGELQLAFAPWKPQDLRGWLAQPAVRGCATMCALGLIGFYLYIRRTMRYLDPRSAVPERVRTAFDTLTEAVIVLDADARVMLTNRSFKRLAPPSERDLTGSPIRDLHWLIDCLSERGLTIPWTETLKDSQPRLGLRIRVVGGELGAREVKLNSSPISDGYGRVRGCLVTFDDVTNLYERKMQLRSTIATLRASREEIARKNEELTLLATRDPLTGALNRRAFTQEADRAIASATAASQPVCCIMCDIDHFKSINDRFGHGGGDEVLKAVTKALLRGLRTGDLLGRYGGEEFCILLPNASLEQAEQIAERLRADVEANAGKAVRQFADITVTMSFGVEQFGSTAQGFERLVDRADQALYHSKKNGRNRVTPYARIAS